eukprot:6213886-Pleurochrysis_carterae.AAC.3
MMWISAALGTAAQYCDAHSTGPSTMSRCQVDAVQWQTNMHNLLIEEYAYVSLPIGPRIRQGAAMFDVF